MITKKLLEQALANLPKKNSLRYAETYIKNALAEISKYEKSSTNKATPADAWKGLIAASAIQASASETKQSLAKESSLSILDRMIEEEKNKLATLSQPIDDDTVDIGLPPSLMSD